MGVKCSLLGHDYGESEIERERDEDGDEVVRTAKRVERCRQCGRTRTISENTEVTTLEAAAGVVREADGTVVATTDEAAITDEVEGDVVIESPGGERAIEEATTADRPTSDGEPLSGRESSSDDGNGAVEPLGTADPESGTGRSSGADGSSTPPETDDGVIDDATETVAIDRIGHDREPQRPTRAPGEWPTDPDRDGAATSSPDDAGSVADGGAAVASWPGDDATGTAIADDETEAATRGKRRGRQPGDTLSCGSCRFTRLVADSPLRAGDICPDCGNGYLAWETRKG